MSSFFNELKRRNVVRVGLAYLVMSWLILQIGDVAADSLDFPQWFMPMVFVVLGLGFPLALFLSWAFEMTTEGVKKTAEVDADASITPSTGRKLDRMIIGALVIAVAFLVYERASVPTIKVTPSEPQAAVTAKTEGPKTIAVLPFADMSPDKSQEYFADGISEELLNVLVRVKGLRVSSRTSSFSFKGTNTPIPEIASVLKVDHILEGSVRSQGNRVRITAQLIDVKTDSHLWSETYDRELTDIFAIQDEIANAIVEALKVTLIGGGELAKTATSNVEAHNLYLKGLHAMHKRTGPDLLAAIDHLEAAVKLDPDYAAAYTTLGRVFSVMRYYSSAISDDELRARGIAAARRAMELAPDDPGALATSGLVKALFEWDFSGAERDFKRAIELSPNDAEIHNFYGDFLRDTFDLEASLRIEKRAAELDPLFPVNWQDIGWNYLAMGRYEEALAQFDRALALELDRERALNGRISVLLEAGDAEAARREIQHYESVWPNESANILYLKALLAILEGDKQADDLIEAFVAATGGFGAGLGIAGLYLKAGRIDEAVAELEKAYERKDVGLVSALFLFDPQTLPDDPRINEIMNRPLLRELTALRRKNLGLDKRP